jgi:hypothetical protein
MRSRLSLLACAVLVMSTACTGTDAEAGAAAPPPQDVPEVAAPAPAVSGGAASPGGVADFDPADPGHVSRWQAALVATGMPMDLEFDPRNKEHAQIWAESWPGGAATAPADAASGSNAREQAATDADPATPGLVLGEYACDENHWDVSARRMVYQPRGYFELLPGGRYRWLDNGGEGTYRYSAADHQIAWLTGPLAEKQPSGTTYQRNQRTTQIDIRFAGDVEWSCGHNLE